MDKSVYSNTEPRPPMDPPDPQRTQHKRCGVCGQHQSSLVLVTCGHSLCRQCISRYWGQSGPSADYSCRQCRKRCRTQPAINPETHPPSPKKTKLKDNHCMIDILTRHKANMKTRFEKMCEGIIMPGSQTLLRKIDADPFITKGESEEVNNEHEVWQVEAASRPQTTEATTISCDDIFKPLEQEGHIRTVMTKGVAGIGKTISVQKFILDWTEEKANQDVDFMFVLPFRELNLVKYDQYSLHRLLLDFHSELSALEDADYRDCNIVFIFDGLDESRLPLNFQENQKLVDVNLTASVDELMTSLIQGALLPSAFIWITSRPAAANHIPSQCVDLVTELQGFNNLQKEEYFRKRTSDHSLANRIIAHIKTTRSLDIMCYLPAFCWIAATVLQVILEQEGDKEAPKTLTEMFAHFLRIQTTRKNLTKQDDSQTVGLLKSDKDVILKLADLAFTHLENGNYVFNVEDLRQCGIDVSEASVYSGMCTEIFREECVLNHKKVYCFVHLSIQEFLAALHVFSSYLNKNVTVVGHFLKKKAKVTGSADVPLDEMLKGAVNKALESKNGHLDLFVRFLHGISLQSNQRLLLDLLPHTQSSPKTVKKTVKNLKAMQRPNISPERWLNLFHCLMEIQDSSSNDEIQSIKVNGSMSEFLSLTHCSAVAHMLLVSDEVLDELDLRKYRTSPEGRRRLVTAVRCCRNAILVGCGLTEKSCETIDSALQCANSTLRQLDLSFNDLQKSEEKLLSALQSPRCKLEILRLAHCHLTENACKVAAFTLRTVVPLLELDLSDSDLKDSGVQLLSVGLSTHLCKLRTLRLSGCLISDKGFSALASALKTNPFYLEELDLSYNHPGDSGVRELTERLNNPKCNLETLRYDHGGECRLKPGLRKYACDLTLDPNTATTGLAISEGDRKVTRVSEEQPYPEHPDRFDPSHPQVLCREGLSGRCYWEAEWSGSGAYVAMSYGSIQRQGGGYESWLGRNDKSWSLSCESVSESAYHNNYRFAIPAIPPNCSRVGVYLDWPAGTLSFYSVSSDTLTHLHTFHSTFTEPLYPGVVIWSPGSSVSLSQIT